MKSEGHPARVDNYRRKLGRAIIVKRDKPKINGMFIIMYITRECPILIL